MLAKNGRIMCWINFMRPRFFPTSSGYARSIRITIRYLSRKTKPQEA